MQFPQLCFSHVGRIPVKISACIKAADMLNKTNDLHILWCHLSAALLNILLALGEVETPIHFNRNFFLYANCSHGALNLNTDYGGQVLNALYPPLYGPDLEEEVHSSVIDHLLCILKILGPTPSISR